MTLKFRRPARKGEDWRRRGHSTTPVHGHSPLYRSTTTNKREPSPPIAIAMVLPVSVPGAVLLAPSPAHGEVSYDLMYYLKGAAAGGICCSVTHGALTPVDVVKTRVQLDPVKVRAVVDDENNGLL
jgi:hypothetical protein